MNLNLRNARLEKGMFQSELAEKAGIKQQNISMYEQGKVVPSVQTAAKIAKVLGKTMEELFCSGLSVPVMGNVPQRQHESDAGADLVSTANINIQPLSYATVPTGTHIALPAGYVGYVFARSGNGQKGIGITHGVGVIDAGYRGEIKVCLFNADAHNVFEVREGMRIAQLVVMPIPPIMFNQRTPAEWSEMDYTERGIAGFGSTGDE